MTQASIVNETIQKTLEDPTPLKLGHFNAGLRALQRSRRRGEPLTDIIRFYNTMLDKSVLPDVETYEYLILALVHRDYEVHNAIWSLESVLKEDHLRFGRAIPADSYDRSMARLNRLKAEDNFGSAMSLFESVLAVKGINKLYSGAFALLIRSCAIHCNVRAAIHVFAQLERTNKRIDYPVYRHMIETFSNVQMIKHAEDIFKEFLNPPNHKKNLSSHPDPEPHQSNSRPEQIKVWNSMIESYFRAEMPDKAIELLMRMLASTAGNQFAPFDTPIVTPSTFRIVIIGFIHSGDISSALTWFERLLAQEKSVAGPYEGLGGAPMRPDMPQWHELLEGLALNGKVDDLNRLYHMMRSLADQDRLVWRPVDQLNVYAANLSNLKNLDDETALKILNFISEDIASPLSKVYIPDNLPLVNSLAVAYIERGEFLTAAELTRKWYSLAHETRINPSLPVLREMQHDFNSITRHISTNATLGKGDLDFHTATIIVRLHTMLGLSIKDYFSPWYLHAYGLARFQNAIDYRKLTPHDWNLLLDCALEMESAALAGREDLTVVPQYAFKGVASLLEDLAQQGLTLNDLDKTLGVRTMEHLQTQLGDANCLDLFSRLGPSYLETFNHFLKTKYPVLESAMTQDSEPIVQIPTPTPEFPPLKIFTSVSRMVNAILKQISPRSSQERMEEAYTLLKFHLSKQQAVDPYVLSCLITLCGRNNDMDKVRELYAIGQAILQCVPPDKRLSRWVSIESSMVIALGHLGNIEAAHVHRLRILDQGCAPTADAYGVLIQYMKDTTDDTSGSIALFQEAVERGVMPSIYLFNNIISKLAKARKADYALEIFRQMKNSGVPPSNITYSAIIGACARVGDVQLAEAIFSEMMEFTKPRVPAFNTMMQLFTTTKPNRTSSLYYYNKLLEAGVEPSAYTYKVHRFVFLSFVMLLIAYSCSWILMDLWNR